MNFKEYVENVLNESEEEKKYIEAYGVKGMNSTKWRKVFKSQEAFEKWVDDNDAEVRGSRKISEVEAKSFKNKYIKL